MSLNPSRQTPSTPKQPSRAHARIWLMSMLVVLGFAAGFWANNAFFAAASGESVALPAQVVEASTPSQPAEERGLVRFVSVDDDPFLGPADAPITIVEFSDFECVFCRRFRNQTLDQLLSAYAGKVRFVYRDFPLSDVHPNAHKAAEAAQCANEQGAFWKMHDRIFLHSLEWSKASDPIAVFSSYASALGLNAGQFETCLKAGKYADEVNEDLEDGKALGVNGTPSFFINGQPLAGAASFSMFSKIIEAQLGALP